MKLATPLNLAFVAALIAITVAGFLLLPADRQLPVRWALDGHPGATLPRNLALLQMPTATALIWLVVYAVSRFGNDQRRAGAERVLRLIAPALAVLFVLVQLIIVLLGAGVALPFFRVS
jgi:hypothetical protein